MPPHEQARDAPAPAATDAAAAPIGGPRTIQLASAIDLAGFRRACRALWAEQIEPARVAWHTRDDAGTDRFEPADARPAPSDAPAVQVPASFLSLCESVVLHRDPGRFGLLYRLLWRFQIEPGLRHDPLDADRVLAGQWAQAVRRDVDRMKAIVRFRTIAGAPGAAPVHVAWFEPEHHIVEATAPFFVHRFAQMHWAILTPERSVRWDGERLELGGAARRDQAPPADADEALWLSCYQSIFGPARRLPQRPDPVPAQPVTPGDPASRSLPALREALERCRECPIGEHATQAVPGEGPTRARLMFVGEQPGDQEDLQGRPFVGPAGQLFDRALAELGFDRRRVYITNAVKHFKFELRGKRRIHKTPAEQEAAACLHWLEREIELVEPEALVALGATAARQLMGRPIAVTRAHGQWLKRADGRRVLITLHPSALLRMEPADKQAAYAAWLDDLRRAGQPFSG